jgi:hypothetical protein
MLRAWVEELAYIDYALIEAGSTTNFSAKTIFVDDTNEAEIWYTGQWMDPRDVLPLWVPPNLGNQTVRCSNTPGDSFEFRFSGK